MSSNLGRFGGFLIYIRVSKKLYATFVLGCLVYFFIRKYRCHKIMEGLEFFFYFCKGLKKCVCQFSDGSFGGFPILIRVSKNLNGTFWLGSLGFFDTWKY